MAIISSSYVGSGSVVNGFMAAPDYRMGGGRPSSLFFPAASGSAEAVTTEAIYRGRLGGSYVYSTGTPPGGGAVDIVIIGYI